MIPAFAWLHRSIVPPIATAHLVLAAMKAVEDGAQTAGEWLRLA
jgi:hypothetical protein